MEGGCSVAETKYPSLPPTRRKSTHKRVHTKGLSTYVQLPPFTVHCPHAPTVYTSAAHMNSIQDVYTYIHTYIHTYIPTEF